MTGKKFKRDQTYDLSRRKHAFYAEKNIIFQ